MAHGVEYGKASYWDDRYNRDADSFDWYQRWSGLQPLLEPIVRKEHKILMLGCGNSTLSKDMVDAGYQSMVNLDISSVVIDKMKLKHPEMTWLVQDCTKLTYDGEFDCALDKGIFVSSQQIAFWTLDALLCGDESVAHSAAYLTGVCRALRKNGVFVEITYGAPSSRLCYLQASNLDWTVKQDKIAKPESPNDVHFVYICTKN